MDIQIVKEHAGRLSVSGARPHVAACWSPFFRSLMEDKMSEQFNPLLRPASAAQQVVLEVVRAGSCTKKHNFLNFYTHA
ncbi:hypothetical protein FU190_24410 [Escherichia coli]|nr:hypothetical protein [Escherichia coli]